MLAAGAAAGSSSQSVSQSVYTVESSLISLLHGLLSAHTKETCPGRETCEGSTHG